jgi:hypothetical protein
LITVKFRLLVWFDRAKSNAVLVSFQHDPFAAVQVEPEDFSQGFYDMLHAVYVIIVQQDFITGNLNYMLLKDGFGFGGLKRSHVDVVLEVRPDKKTI